MKDVQLWEAIQAFQLDQEEAEFTFSKRLARDNKWTHSFACRVVEEYKKFIYLCCVSDQAITPSDEVDQAWHLHLTYTRSYWDEMCAGVLKRPLHHNPTKGGELERKKFSGCYDYTFEKYLEEFETEPPIAVWPNKQSRFTNIRYQRVNVGRFWLIQKPTKRLAYSMGILVLIITSLSFMRSEATMPWFGFLMIILAIVFIIRLFKNGTGGSGGGGSSCWSCSVDSGCNSGCGSGCGGCGGD